MPDSKAEDFQRLAERILATLEDSEGIVTRVSLGQLKTIPLHKLDWLPELHEAAEGDTPESDS